MIDIAESNRFTEIDRIGIPFGDYEWRTQSYEVLVEQEAPVELPDCSWFNSLFRILPAFLALRDCINMAQNTFERIETIRQVRLRILSGIVKDRK